MNYFRQGDLSFTPIKKLPENLKIVLSSILALGENTGHKHQLLERVEQQFQVLEDEKGIKYLSINQPTDLVHEEHKTITIQPGFYWMQNEREYDYFTLEVNRVQD